MKKMKLTASKMSRGALATANSVFPREGRCDVGALLGCYVVGVGVGVGALVGCSMVGVGVGRLGARVGRVGVSVGTGKGTGSCKSGKGESKDDFELHNAFFCCYNTKH